MGAMTAYRQSFGPKIAGVKPKGGVQPAFVRGASDKENAGKFVAASTPGMDVLEVSKYHSVSRVCSYS